MNRFGFVEPYVTLEIAKQMKDLGFHEYTLTGYKKIQGSGENDEDWTIVSEEGVERDWNGSSNEGEEVYSRPTQALALLWLRKMYLYHLYVELDENDMFYYTVLNLSLSNDKESPNYYWSSIDVDYDEDDTENGYYSEPEEAIMAGLKRLLDIVEYKRQKGIL